MIANCRRRCRALLIGLLAATMLAGRPPVAEASDILAADGVLLFRIDSTTGARTILSDFTDPGQGPVGASFAVAAGPGGAVYVTDGASDETGRLFKVSADGMRVVFSNAAQASQGDPWHTPHGVFVDTDGSILVSDRGIGGGGNEAGLWRASATDGSRVKLTDFDGTPEGIALDATGHILLGDLEGGTNCHTFGGCGALYEVDPATGTRTTLANFGAPGQGPLGEDAGLALALDTDGTILVVDGFAPPGNAGCFDATGCGVLFRWDPLTQMHDYVTKYGDAADGTLSFFRPTGVVVDALGTIFISPCPGSNGVGAVCTVDRATGVRSTFSDFGDPGQGPVGVQPRALAIVDFGATTTTTTATTSTTLGEGVVDAFILPKRVTYVPNPADPARSRLVTAGIFDTGSQTTDLGSAATLQIGDLIVNVPSLSRVDSKFVVKNDGFFFQVRPARTGSSKAIFRMKATGLADASIDPNGPITLRFANAETDGIGTVRLQDGRYTLRRVPGTLIAPNLYLFRVKATVVDGANDKLAMRVGLATGGTTPPTAPEVEIAFGDTYHATIPASAFTKDGDRFASRGTKGGAPSVVIDYRRELLRVVASGVELGTFADGAAPLVVTVRLDAAVRGNAVRAVKRGRSLKY